MPEEKILSLSDAFENQKVKASVELKVRMLNINHGKNQELMEKCKVLGDMPCSWRRQDNMWQKAGSFIFHLMKYVREP